MTPSDNQQLTTAAITVGESPRLHNLRHAVFVMEMIEHGIRRKAYMAAYPGASAKAADVGAWRLMNNPAISLQIIDGIAAQRAARMMDMHNKLAVLEEKRKVLADILRGEAATEIETRDSNGNSKTVLIKANTRDRIRAIQIDNGMEDEYWEMLSRMEHYQLSRYTTPTDKPQDQQSA